MGYLLVSLSIGFIIFIHELGHFIAAKRNQIAVQDFSLGFGPSLWQKKIGQTVYHLRAIPLGGYVLPMVTDENEFFKIAVQKRIWLSLGGPLANFIFAFLLYVLLHLSTSSFVTEWYLFPFIVLQKSFVSFASAMQQIVQAVPLLITAPHKLSGIVGIVSLGGQSSLLGWSNFLAFVALLNINLGILNLLPLPALDGGKVILYALEKIHPSAKHWQTSLSLLSWIFLLFLFVYTTGADIVRLINA